MRLRRSCLDFGKMPTGAAATLHVDLSIPWKSQWISVKLLDLFRLPVEMGLCRVDAQQLVSKSSFLEPDETEASKIFAFRC